MDALRKQIQSLVDYVLNHCFWTYAMLSKFWFALISTRGMTLDKLLLPRSSRFLALQVIWGSLVSAIAYFDL